MPRSDDQSLAHLRKRIAQAPKEPGVYRWKDREGTVLYVGKAKNLRDRLRSYVAKTADKGQGPWKLSMLQQISDVEFTVVRNDLEALVFETNLIKHLRPKYNVMMKDDKNYVYVRVGMHEAYPTVSILRQLQEDKAKYFGPFTSAWEARHLLDLFHQICPFRCCRDAIEKLNRGKEPEKKPCLEYQIGRCCGLCIGALTRDEYRARIEKLIAFLRGDRAWAAKELEKRMQEAAVAKKFETAGKLRDQLRLLKTLEEDQVVSDTSGEDLDIVGTAVLSGRAHVVILLERNGKVIGERSFALQGRAESAGDVLEQFLPQYYSETQDLPQAVIVGEEFPSQGTLGAWLSERRGLRTDVRVPARGKKSHLLQLAEKNAAEKARQQEISWETEARNVQGGLEGLQTALGLGRPPHRIEGYDISHLGGTQTVGSMVVLKDGKPHNEHYRHFIIRTLKKGDIDDYAAMREVLTRRFRHIAVNAEVDAWKTQGVEIRKARKADMEAIAAIRERNGKSVDDDMYKEMSVAVAEGNVVGMARLRHRSAKLTELCAVWVDESHRGEKLGHVLLRTMLRTAKRGKVYLVVEPELEEYYAALGFRYAVKPPAELLEATKHYAISENRMAMVYDALENKADLSLKTVPDLLLIDGGKGQLAVAVEALKKFGLHIPVASLAKREEELFAPGNESPVPLAADSPSVLLLRRLRDEAHRFANRLREMRLSKDMRLQVEAAVQNEG